MKDYFQAIRMLPSFIDIRSHRQVVPVHQTLFASRHGPGSPPVSVTVNIEWNCKSTHAKGEPFQKIASKSFKDRRKLISINMRGRKGRV